MLKFIAASLSSSSSSAPPPPPPVPSAPAPTAAPLLTAAAATSTTAAAQATANKAFLAFNNASSTPSSSHTSSPSMASNTSVAASVGSMAASVSQQSKLLGALNGNAASLLATLISSSSSASPSTPSTPPLSASSLDPWATSTPTQNASVDSPNQPLSHHHLPLSISQSINNPGLPSGVIVSSNAANGMSMLSNHSSSPGMMSRSDTPGLGHGSTGSNSNAVVGGGKLLLAASSSGASLSSASALTHSNMMGHGIGSGAGGNQGQSENEKVYYLIVDLMSPSTREGALLELSKKREQWDDLALVLWHSFGVMSALLQEIVAVYPLLAPPSLTAHASNRVCNALALLQCVASHNDTRSLFLAAHIPLFLYPFLNTTSKTRPFEYLRLTSLGVIGALVKQNDNSDVINFLLSTEIIPLCLRIMETGSELSKTVAIFIVQKILLDEMGLGYICQTYERFYAVGTVLSNMVMQLVESQAVRLLKHVVRCYLRLSDNLRAREALRACLPEPLRDATFSPLLKGDMVTKRCLATLLLNLSDRVDST